MPDPTLKQLWDLSVQLNRPAAWQTCTFIYSPTVMSTSRAPLGDLPTNATIRTNDQLSSDIETQSPVHKRHHRSAGEHEIIDLTISSPSAIRPVAVDPDPSDPADSSDVDFRAPRLRTLEARRAATTVPLVERLSIPAVAERSPLREQSVKDQPGLPFDDDIDSDDFPLLPRLASSRGPPPASVPHHGAPSTTSVPPTAASSPLAIRGRYTLNRGGRKSLYRKKSDASTAVVEDPIEACRLSLLHLNENNVDWELMAEGDRNTSRKPFQAMHSVQRKMYFEYLDLLRQYIDRDIGIDDFDQPAVFGVWNWPTWNKILLTICGRMKMRGRSADITDCWISDMSRDRPNISVNHNVGRPHYKVVPCQNEKRTDANHNARDRFISYTIDGVGRGQSPVARLVAILILGLPLNGDADQASHKCHEKRCVNPYHLIWENDRDNKDRDKCVRANAVACIHDIRCIWTNLRGVFRVGMMLTIWAMAVFVILSALPL